MILRAKHNFIIHPFFKFYAVWKTNRNFKDVKIIGEFHDKGLPVLLISNHISWWDGFWAMYINLKVLKRKFHFMMLEEQIRKYWFFNHTGGYSVNKNSRSIIETLDYTAEILSDNKNMVLIFPQGEIETMHKQTFDFEKGIERMLQNRTGDVQIVFLANLVDYFSDEKPSIYFHIQDYAESRFDVKSIQAAYNTFYREVIEKQRSIL